MSGPGASVIERPPSSRLHDLLDLALELSGAGQGVIALAGGAVAAWRGGAEGGADLARRALGTEPEGSKAKPAKGARFIAAAPIKDAKGARLGVFALASDSRFASRGRLPEALERFASLAAGELAAPARSADDREPMLAEIDHRVRNVLASVQSIASQSARRAGSLDGFLKAFTGRLKAMASAQELLTATRGRGASIHNLATASLSALAPGQTRWEGPDLFLSPRAANALALALHELAVNAVRHGGLASESGRVDVRWWADEAGGFELDWVETGGPRVVPATRKGFGSMLLEEVTGRELDGQVKTEFRASGVRVSIRGSAKALAAETAPASPVQTQVAAPPPPGASSGPPVARGPRRVDGMRIIIVEDAILLAMELEAGLIEAGANVVGAAALVEEAMTLVDLDLDAAVLDCNLNGVSVSPVAEALAARGVPFLFATGYGESRGAPEGFDAPIVRKPYDVAQITAALAELTGRT